MKIKLSLLFCYAILCAIISGCHNPNDTLRTIKNRGEIVVITDNSAHGFYLYQDQPMGFEYELAREFADFLNVKLLVITPGWEKMFRTLLDSNGDLIASSLTKTERRKTRVIFSDEYMPVQQQVII